MSLDLAEVKTVAQVVLITGAGGRMARAVRPALRQQYPGLRVLSRHPLEDLHPDETPYITNLADATAVGEAAAGVDTIVHLAGIPDEAPFDAILESNILGTYNVFEAARQQGVRRVVLASSNHVTGFYRCDSTVSVTDPPRPDSLYAASKVFGEALGRLYHDKWGLEVVVLRIGSFRAAPADRRQLSTWLSERDWTHLLNRSLECESVGYLAMYGVSANRRSWWLPERGSHHLKYVPTDDAERFAHEILATEPPDSVPDEPELQGGSFTNPDYRGGYY